VWVLLVRAWLALELVLVALVLASGALVLVSEAASEDLGSSTRGTLHLGMGSNHQSAPRIPANHHRLQIGNCPRLRRLLATRHSKMLELSCSFCDLFEMRRLKRGQFPICSL